MNEKLLNRLENLAKSHNMTPDEFLSLIDIGSLRVVKANLYSVVLTDAAVGWLQSKGVKSFIRGRSYYALSPDEAFSQFQKDYPVCESILMVNITEV
jgi:hypothetical protein